MESTLPNRSRIQGDPFSVSLGQMRQAYQLMVCHYQQVSQGKKARPGDFNEQDIRDMVRGWLLRALGWNRKHTSSQYQKAYESELIQAFPLLGPDVVEAGKKTE